MILFIKHIDIEGPGTAGEFYSREGVEVSELNVSAGDSLDVDLARLKGVVILGGPMNVYEEDAHSFLKQENEFVCRVIGQRIPLVGICLGAQLIAKALGAPVTKALLPEIGWSTVTCTNEGKADALFRGCDTMLSVFQWHEDTFAIPPGAILLAKGHACAHQAFRYGETTYGLQFHIEVTDADIDAWCRRYFKDNTPVEQMKHNEMLLEYEAHQRDFHAQAERIYGNFLTLMTKRTAAV